MKIYIMNKLPTPYTDDLFRRLAADPEVDLQVYHLWRGSWRRPWKTELATGYPNKYMRVVAGCDWEFLGRARRERDACFIIADWGHLPSLAVIAARLRHRAPVIIWTDTPQQQLSRAWPKRIVRNMLLDWLLPKVDLILAPGQIAHDVLVTMGVDSQQIVNLPFLVDIDHPGQATQRADVQAAASALRQRVGCDTGGTVYSMISTIYTHVKGQDIGLKAFAQSVRDLPPQAPPLGLLIVGDGPDRAAMEQLTRELGIENRVAFVGWQEPSQMDAIYAATDVVVHPSRRDAYPLVVIEAMSWGKPVVGSDVCGSVIDRVRNDYNGYAFPSGDIAALAEAISMLCRDHNRLVAMGRHARLTAEDWPLQRGVEIIKSAAARTLHTSSA